MMYLFDDADNQSMLHDCKDWEAAEAKAREENWTLVGEFVGWYDEDWEYAH